MNSRKHVSLEEKEALLMKQEQRLAKQKSIIREAKRKRDDAMKFRFGGLVIKAGLAGETERVILGILVNAVKQIEVNRAAYANLGDRKFSEDAARKLKQSAAVPVTESNNSQSYDHSQSKTPAQRPQPAAGAPVAQAVHSNQARPQSPQAGQGQSPMHVVERSAPTATLQPGQVRQGTAQHSSGESQAHAMTNQPQGQSQS